MEQRDGKLYLDETEMALTGLTSPLGVDDIDILGLTEESTSLDNELFHLRSADDDELTNAERGYIVASSERLQKRHSAVKAVIEFWMSETE